MTVAEHQVENFITKIKSRMDAIPREYLNAGDLYDLGLFSTRNSAHLFAISGTIPCVHITPKRVLLDRSDVLSFIEEKYHAKSKTAT